MFLSVPGVEVDVGGLPSGDVVVKNKPLRVEEVSCWQWNGQNPNIGFGSRLEECFHVATQLTNRLEVSSMAF